MRALHPWLSEVLGIRHLADEQDPFVAVGRRLAVEILRDGCIRAIGNAVLAQVARAQVIRDHLQIAGAGRDARVLPLRRRMALPRRLRRRGRRLEMEQSRLVSRFHLHFQRRLVLPADSHTAGYPRDGRRAVRLALLTCRLVLRRIPGGGDLLRRGRDGNVPHFALRRSEHTHHPVLRHDRHPGSGQIDCGVSSRRRRRPRRPLAALRTAVDRRGKQHRDDKRRPPPFLSVPHGDLRTR